MSRGLRVAQAPSKPLLVYDGDCHFCALWIRRCRQITGTAVDYLPSQSAAVTEQFPEIAPDRFAAAVQFIDTSGAVTGGAEAFFRTAAQNPAWRWPLGAYQKFPRVAAVTEGTYRFVAEHRPIFSRLTRWGWGNHTERATHVLTRWLFLRALGLVYLFAFLSLLPQLNGLIGQHGILPVDQFLDSVRQQCESRGLGAERFHFAPTLCWFNSSDAFLHFQCLAGIGLSLVLMAGVAPVVCLSLLWVLFLSLAVAGQDFLGFQWENLLLETGFIAIFLAPLQWLPRLTREAPPSHIGIWLLRLLLFKLMFSSGCVKLLSDDATWHNLTALTYHYQTQPLPPWTAWYANRLPLAAQKFSCAAMFGIEIGAPFLIFFPRRVRFLGAGLLVSLQLLILLTGNFAYFNWLTLALCLTLADDFFLACFVPRAWQIRLQTGNFGRTACRWPAPVLGTVAAVLLLASSFWLAVTLGFRAPLRTPLAWVAGELEPFRLVNQYGLFAIMTTQRNEIIVEGSMDHEHWLPYEFKYKPGDLNHRPGFIAPLQPRLDWQMWFAALGDYRQNPWFENFCLRLLQGSPEVLELLAKNPFPGTPPKWIRADLYQYRFSTPAERSATGAWWQREYVGQYLPPVALRE